MSTQPQQHQDVSNIQVAMIRVAPEFNPRKRFSDAETREFADRISQSGWVSPLLVRPDPERDDGYVLVAGERRFRAVSELGWDVVPVTIRQMDDVEHRKLALVENVDRRQLSPAEEALSAQAHTDAYGGDHAAAAASLGWTVQRLQHRLKLMHADPEVMDALLHEKIQIGHAELLSGIPAENQRSALPRIIEQAITVATLREQLNGFASKLSKAIFPLNDCHSCQFNSECQRGLFAEAIDGGLCTNKTCYSQKTTEALNQKREELRADFGSVVLHSEKVAGSTIPLVMLGEHGVGEAQYQACRTCEFRGVIITDTPGSNLGAVSGPTCFNIDCHSAKAKDYRGLRGESGDDDTSDAQDGNTGESDSTGKLPTGSTKVKGTAGKTNADSKSKGKAAAKGKVRATMKSVVDQYAGSIRRAAVTVVQQDASIAHALSIYGLLRIASDEIPGETFTSICKRVGVSYQEPNDSCRQNVTKAVLELAGRSAEDLDAMAAQVALLIIEHNPEGSAYQGKINRRALSANIVKRANLDLQPFLVVDAAFLGSHTRAGIETVLEGSGFKAWCEGQEDGAKRYTGIISKGKDEMIKAVMESGFDFSSYRPAEFDDERKAWEQFKKL